MRRVEVRCCCSPTKLLGTLPFPECAIEFAYPLVQPKTTDFLRAARRSVPFEKVTLSLSTWRGFDADGKPIGGQALKADGIPIETLRRVPGFIEAGAASSLPKESS